MPATTNKVSIVRFCEDPNLLNLELWSKQRDILTDFWEGDYRVGIWSLGRRSGKTLMSAVCAVYAGCVMADEYKKTLRRGEPFYIICVANALDQARLALHNIRDLIESSPILKPLIVRSTADSLELSNGAIFKALPSSSRTGRGMACPMMIMDEAAHFLDTDGNAAGDQLYQALSPSVAQFGNLGKILMLSSPWLQAGIFWDLYKQSSTGDFPYMQQINLPSWEVNPTLSKEFLEQEKARDPEMFAADTPQQQQFWQQWRAIPENVTYSDKAKDRGSLFHFRAEQHFKQPSYRMDSVDVVDEALIAEVKPFWQSVQNVLPRITDIRLLESAIWHEVGCYAGTVDMVASFDGVPCILDWKTATKPKKLEHCDRYPLQLTSYCACINRMYGTRIKNGVIVVVLPDTEAQVLQFELKDYWQPWITRLVAYWGQQITPLAAA